MATPAPSRSIVSSIISSAVSAAVNGTVSRTANATMSSQLASSLVNATSTAIAAIPTATPLPVDTAGQEASHTLDTRVTAAFGILGAFCILTGIALLFTGSAYRRLSVFLVTCATFAIIVLSLILHFGIEGQIHLPSQGVIVGYLFACLAAGTVAGLGAVVFHRGAKIVVPTVAGFLLGLTIQCLKDDGLIQPIGYRYFLFLGTTGLGFVISIIPRFFDGALLASTAFLGAFGIVLGIDCYSTQNLKEFYVYNLGFKALFKKLDGHFPISAGMQIELGVVLLLTIIGTAVQIRLYGAFESKIKAFLSKKNRSNAENDEEKAAKRITQTLDRDMEKFEHRYSKAGFPFSAPRDSYVSNTSYSPAIPSISNTPKSLDMPLLPELPYRHNSTIDPTNALALREEVLAPALSPQQSSVSSNSTPTEPAFHQTRASLSEASRMSIEADIKEKQRDLEEIARIRRSIGIMRTTLATGTNEGERSRQNSNESQPATSAPVQISTVPVAPRPISQHAMLVRHSRSPSQLSIDALAATDPSPRPMDSRLSASRPSSAAENPRHSGSYSMNNINRFSQQLDRPQQARRASTQLLQTNAPETHDRPSYTRSSSTGRLNAATSTERIVTGLLPARPSPAHTPEISSMPRSQTMDIRDLDARHRKRLSQMQGTFTPSITRTEGATIMPVNMSPPARKIRPHSRRNSSTDMAALSNPMRFARPANVGVMSPQQRHKQQRRPSRMMEAGMPVAERKRDSLVSSKRHSQADEITRSASQDLMASQRSKDSNTWLDY